MRDYLHLAASQTRVLLSDVVDRFAGIPWGWKPEWETVLLIARLFMAGEIKLVLEGSDLDPASAMEPLTKSARFKQVSILKRKTADATTLKRARELYKDLFSKVGREEEDAPGRRLTAPAAHGMAVRTQELRPHRRDAAPPGKADIDAALDPHRPAARHPRQLFFHRSPAGRQRRLARHLGRPSRPRQLLQNADHRLAQAA
jgi:hypothetical protein